MTIGLRKFSRALFFFFLAAAWVLPPAAFGGQIYKWRDAGGALHFADSPPAGDGYEELGGEAAPASSPKEDAASKAAATEAHGAGMFWKVTGPGGSTSYLLGTIHSEDARVLALSPAVNQALDAAGGLVMEMVPDAAALATAAAAMLYLDGRSLQQTIGEALFQRAAGALAPYGMPAVAVDRMKPWAVMAVLSTPKPETGEFLDMVLYRRAVARGVPVHGLETAREQVAVFDGISEADQVLLLEQTLEDLANIPGLLEEITSAYVRDDLGKVAGLAEAAMGGDASPAAGKLMRRLNDERNLRMAQRLQPYLADGNVFVAVGALHLAGEEGLIRLLRDGGYRLTPLPRF